MFINKKNNHNLHKLLELKTKALSESLYIGNYKTRFKGNGLEFEGYKNYENSDNSKNIDFIKSNNEGKIFVKLYNEQRELSIYFILDLNNSFFTDLYGNKKIDIIFNIFYLVSLSAIKQGNKIGSFIFKDHLKKLFISKKGKQNFINIINEIDSIGNTEKSFLKSITNKFKKTETKRQEVVTDSIKYFNNLNIKNSLIFFLTDDLDSDTNQLKLLGSKNDLVLCNIFNSFENTLKGNGVLGFGSKFNNINIDLSNETKKKEYIKLRKNKIEKMKFNTNKIGAKYIYLDENIDVYKELFKLFKK